MLYNKDHSSYKSNFRFKKLTSHLLTSSHVKPPSWSSSQTWNAFFSKSFKAKRYISLNLSLQKICKNKNTFSVFILIFTPRCTCDLEGSVLALFVSSSKEHTFYELHNYWLKWILCRLFIFGSLYEIILTATILFTSSTLVTWRGTSCSRNSAAIDYQTTFGNGKKC